MSDHVLLGALVATALGGVFPWINAELVVVGSAVLVPPEQLPLLVLAGASGHLVAKSGVYGLARFAPSRLPDRATRLLERSDRLTGSRGAAVLSLFASAAVGIPPFYLATLAAGVLRVPALLFAGAGFAGLVVRYAVVAWTAATAAGGFGPGLP